MYQTSLYSLLEDPVQTLVYTHTCTHSHTILTAPGLVERKKRWAAQQLAADQERKKTMELEETFKSAAKRGIPREVHLSSYHNW